MKARLISLMGLGLALAAAPLCAQVPAVFTLSLLHVNDTHSKLEPTQSALRMDIDDTLKSKPVYVELGGFPRLWTAADQIRDANRNVLFLHAGDAFQGTLYFTQYQGKADLDFLNAIGIDALALGNHEFDKGPSVLKSGLLELAKFDVLSANIDFTREPELDGVKILPYVIRTIGGQKVGIIGITQPETPYISSPGKNIVFSDPTAAARRAVAELEEKGVDKIIALSHYGYAEDRTMAAAVSGLDVVVSAHTHTLLGDMTSLGLASRGDYPTVVKNVAGDTVLVVQAWEWAKVLGKLDVGFDTEGKVVSWKGQPMLLVGDSWLRIYDLSGPDGKPVRVEFTRTAGTWKAMESDGRAYVIDPPVARKAAHLAALDKVLEKFKADPRIALVADKPEGAVKLATYSSGVKELKAKVACEAGEALMRGNNVGPGPIIADAMLRKTGADIAVMNPGGVRTNINPGSVSVAQIYELQPFGNTLVTLPVSGAELLKVLEDMSDYTITAYTDKTVETALIYVSGATFRLEVTAPRGSRIKDLKIGKSGAYVALDPVKQYKMVVNSFMAAGGDKNDTLKTLAAVQYDTGIIDSEATLEYLQGKTLTNAQEKRVDQSFDQGFSASAFLVTEKDGTAVARFDLPPGFPVSVQDPRLAAAFPKGLDLALGSGLAFDKVDQNGDLLFWGITDRGPNVDSPGVRVGDKVQASKVFASPSFVPSFARIRISAKGIEIEALQTIKTSDGEPVSGLPLSADAVGSSGETALGLDLSTLPTDVDGLDTESIAFDAKDRGFVWISDEYGPFVAKVELATGKIVQKLAPGSGLPAIIAKRIPNRGAEGLAVTPDGNVWFVVQSILDVVPGGTKSSKAPFVRLVQYNPATGKTAQFAYPLDSGYKKTADAKIGDLAALDNGSLAIIEQAVRADGKMYNLIYKIDLAGATDISAVKTADGKEPEAVKNLAELQALGVRVPVKSLLLDLRAYGWDVEKAEGLAVIDSRTLAVASDNDFGLKSELVDPVAGKKDLGDYEVQDGQLIQGGRPVSTSLAASPNGEAGKLWIFRLPKAFK